MSGRLASTERVAATTGRVVTSTRLLSSKWFFSALLAAALAAGACTFSVDTEGSQFTCEADEDCGEGFECVHLRDGIHGCFRDGQCDEPAACPCPGKDDSDFDNDDRNCGRCGTECAEGAGCAGGRCIELVCDDGIDNTGDGLTDCEAPECEGQRCGPNGLICQDGDCVCPHAPHSLSCGDGIDHNCNGFIDCADLECLGEVCGGGMVCTETGCDFPEVCVDVATRCDHAACDGMPCGEGCICAEGRRMETICDDGIDNTGDGDIDCEAEECFHRICDAEADLVCSEDGCDLPAVCADTETMCDHAECRFLVCNADDDLVCDDEGCDLKAACLDTETPCGDGDPDCDGRPCGEGVVCDPVQGCIPSECYPAEPAICDGGTCDGLSCGEGCVCESGVAVETICNDGIDNNDSGAADCDTSDCLGEFCDADETMLCTETGCDLPVVCTDTETMCQHTECEGRVCDENEEFVCSDTGCDLPVACSPATPAICDGGACDGLSCGEGCECQDGEAVEIACDDGVDNNESGLTDCDDPDCVDDPACSSNGNGG